MATKTTEKKKKKPQRSQGPPAPGPVPPVPVPAAGGMDPIMASILARAQAGSFPGPVTSTGQPATTVPTAPGPMPPQAPPQMPPGWGVVSTPFQPVGNVSDIGADMPDVLASLQATGQPIRYAGPEGTMLGTGTTEWVTPPYGGRIQDRASYPAEVAQNRAALTNPAMATVGFTSDQGKTRPAYTKSDPEKQIKAKTARKAVTAERQLNVSAKNMGMPPSLLMAMRKMPAERTPEENYMVLVATVGAPSAAAYSQGQGEAADRALKGRQLDLQEMALRDIFGAYDRAGGATGTGMGIREFAETHRQMVPSTGAGAQAPAISSTGTDIVNETIRILPPEAQKPFVDALRTANPESVGRILEQHGISKQHIARVKAYLSQKRTGSATPSGAGTIQPPPTAPPYGNFAPAMPTAGMGFY